MARKLVESVTGGRGGGRGFTATELLELDVGEEVVSAIGAEETVGRPERVQLARAAGVEADPRLPLAAPVEQAHRARVEVPAQTLDVVSPKAVLVPPVLHPLDLAGEHQQERRQRAQLVDPRLPLLHLHPGLQLPGVPAGAPPVEVHDHDPGVEVAGRAAAVVEGVGVDRVRPEAVCEVGGEVGVAVLGGGEDMVRGEVGGPEAGDVVDDDEVRVEVDDAVDGTGENVGEVDASVVEWLVEGAADGGGDAAADEGGVETVHVEA
ncbi:hypothetical protein C4D60_Mb05t05710 [Musa balbisiana]|uniref:Uncharacterized protein n=1 Tax=Musa balbisiana TaxID=52838 RepID=A0A4S8JTZ7_MUSBA|nr:hypothetical protein C4D60_Mb05t05710 [Musa balbisiana]